MQPLVFSSFAAVSAIGAGRAAMHTALRTRYSGLRRCDLDWFGLEGFIGRVAGVEEVRLPAALGAFDCRNNRLAQMALTTDGFATRVAEAAQRYGADRIGVIVGTSTSGILSSEEAFGRRDTAGALPPDFDYEHTHDLSSLARFARSFLCLRGPALTVSTACSSSARAFLDGASFIQAGLCDAVVVGGADSLCRMTLRGFASLELLSKAPCRPFSADRDGISIGEAAAFVLLERAEDGAGAGNRVGLLGAGASSDAHHMSSPHPEGLGAVAAMRAALEAAGRAPEDVDYVNFHGTGTKANDAMEDLAVAHLLGTKVPCSSTKGWTGHTMGTSGALEAIISTIAIEHDLVPGCLGVSQVDPAFRSAVASSNVDRNLSCVMSNSFGFGGSNCSLVVGRIP